MPIYKIPLLRRIFIPLMKTFSPGTITIRNHNTSHRLKLDFFKHKGYWFHGAERERETIASFRRIVKPGDSVVEVGGHIGYLTQLFSHLVGETGSVTVFEPGSNNLPYIRENTKVLNNTTLIEKAVADFNGNASFFIEDLTGQNNSLHSDYVDFKANAANAHVESQYAETLVEVVTLDSFISQINEPPTFIKVDIEGAELSALKGMTETLKSHRPILMVEVTRDSEMVKNLLQSCEYALLSPTLELLEGSLLSGNVFCIPKERISEIHTD